MDTKTQIARSLAAAQRSVVVMGRDVVRGALEVSHSALAMFGLLVVASAALVLGRPETRQSLEHQLLDWLQQRYLVVAPSGEVDAMAAAGVEVVPSTNRDLAVEPSELTRQQAQVANWLARRYHVAPQALARVVKEAWVVGKTSKVEPTLILAIMAIESSFNPFAQSPVGAQGLMQVMTQVHEGKYQRFGGTLTAVDPLTNLRVGVTVLKECIARAGGLQEGLRYYVGAANLGDDGGYAARVLAEQTHLQRVAAGQQVSLGAPLPATRAPAPAPAPTPAVSASPDAAQAASPSPGTAQDDAAPTPPGNGNGIGFLPLKPAPTAPAPEGAASVAP